MSIKLNTLTGWYLGATLAVVGCAEPPRLDDAQLGTVALQSPKDATRLDQAQDNYSRQIFGGASFNDPRKGFINFTRDDYASYKDYLYKHPEIDGQGIRQQGHRIDLPVLRIAFSTRRMLVHSFRDKRINTVRTLLYFCGADDPLRDFLDFGRLLWSGNFVTSQIAPDIQRALNDKQVPQHYEFFASYTNWNWQSPGAEQTAITVLPPRGDVCLALENEEWPFRATVGRPMVIAKETIASALGPLPRDVFRK